MKFSMKKTVIATILLLTSMTAFASDSDDLLAMKHRLDELEKRLNDVEVQNTLQNVVWSGVLINRYEHFHNNYVTDQDNIDGYSTALAINGEFSINDKTKVYTTFGMAKFWNMEGRDEAWPDWKKSEEGSYQMNGSIPYVDRAYLAYKFDIPLTFSIGRMPTNNGLPINQLDGLSRQGTYPRLAYNAIFDGMALSYDFTKNMPVGNTLNASFFYTPWNNVDPYDRTRQWTDTNGGNNVKTGTSPQFSFLLDYSYTGTTAFKKLTAEYMFYSYTDFYWWGDNNTVPKTAGGANDTFPTGTASNIYDGRANMLYLGVDDIAMSGVNASVSSQFYSSHYVDASPTNTWAASYLFTLNKSFGKNGRTIVGGEYISTDKFYYLDESAALEMIPFYSQPNSKGYHVYVTQRLTDAIGLRVGYYRLQTTANAAAAVSAADYYSYYATLRVDF